MNSKIVILFVSIILVLTQAQVVKNLNLPQDFALKATDPLIEKMNVQKAAP
jgi:hypothetical protein